MSKAKKKSAAAPPVEASLSLLAPEPVAAHILLSARQLHFRHDAPPVLPRAVAGSPLVDAFTRRWMEVLWEERVDRGEDQRWLTVYKLRDEAAATPAAGNPIQVVLEALGSQGV